LTVAAVLNAGGWGTALAAILGRAGHEVRLWTRRPEVADALLRTRENATYLPGVTLPETVNPTHDLTTALAGCEVAVLVPISAGARELARHVGPLLPAAALVAHGTKGLEVGTLMRMSDVIESELGPEHRGRVAALSGPTHAEEVGRGIPAAAVVACADSHAAAGLQRLFNGPTFRVYTNSDTVGVELCASVKNVVALAAGIGDGLGGGDNAKAALMTRSLAEIGRLVRAAHGRALARGLQIAVFTADLFATGNDADNRAAVAKVARDDLDLVGIAVHGPRNAVDKIVKGARMHP